MIGITRNGLMSGADKMKLDGFASVSNETGKFMSADGTWQTPKDDDSWATEDLITSETTAGLAIKRKDGTDEFLIPLAKEDRMGLVGGTEADKLKSYPSLSGTASEVLHGDGTWSESGNGGTTDAAYLTGTLPIEHGGTGAVTAADALSKLGAAASNHTHSQYA